MFQINKYWLMMPDRVDWDDEDVLNPAPLCRDRELLRVLRWPGRARLKWRDLLRRGPSWEGDGIPWVIYSSGHPSGISLFLRAFRMAAAASSVTHLLQTSAFPVSHQRTALLVSASGFSCCHLATAL